jgi:hypothetical protein
VTNAAKRDSRDAGEFWNLITSRLIYGVGHLEIRGNSGAELATRTPFGYNAKAMRVHRKTGLQQEFHHKANPVAQQLKQPSSALKI